MILIVYEHGGLYYAGRYTEGEKEVKFPDGAIKLYTVRGNKETAEKIAKESARERGIDFVQNLDEKS